MQEKVTSKQQFIDVIYHFLNETKHASMTIELEPGDKGGTAKKVAEFLKYEFLNHDEVEIIAKQPNIIWIERIDWR